MRTRVFVVAGILGLLTARAGDDRPLIARRLQDPDWVVRALSAKAIGDTRYDRGIQWLRDRLAKESNEYVQAFALRTIQAFPLQDLTRVGGKELVPAVLNTLKARSPYVRAQAVAVLDRLAGRHVGDARADWEAWWKAAEAGFAFPEAPPAPGGGVTEVKTHRESVFEEAVYDARRRGLDAVFVLDQTSSMQPAIDAAKGQIVEICEYIHLLIPKYRVGLVTYDDVAVLRVPLTDDFASLRRRLSGVSAVGGGDIPEGVDKGLAAAVDPKMSWGKESRKVLIIIGDSPPHDADLPRTVAQAGEWAQSGWVVNGISVGAGGGHAAFQRIAAAAGGAAVNAGDAGDRLVQQMLVLSLGKEHEQALSGFVEVVKAVRAGKTGP